MNTFVLLVYSIIDIEKKKLSLYILQNIIDIIVIYCTQCYI